MAENKEPKVMGTSSVKPIEKPEDGTKVKLNEKVDLIGTGKSVYMEKGKKYKGVQKLHADRLIKRGAAERAN